MTDAAKALADMCEAWPNIHLQPEENRQVVSILRSLQPGMPSREEVARIIEQHYQASPMFDAAWFGECADALLSLPTQATPAQRDWLEDASFENGNYESRCVECEQPFIGYKRRVLCKACSELLRPAAPAQEPVASDVRTATIEECAKLIESGAGMADLIDQEELDQQAKYIRALAALPSGDVK